MSVTDIFIIQLQHYYHYFDFDADFVLKRHDYSMMMLKIDRMKTIDTTVDQTSQQTQQDMHIGSHIVPEKRRTKLI